MADVADNDAGYDYYDDVGDDTDQDADDATMFDHMVLNNIIICIFTAILVLWITIMCVKEHLKLKRKKNKHRRRTYDSGSSPFYINQQMEPLRRRI